MPTPIVVDPITAADGTLVTALVPTTGPQWQLHPTLGTGTPAVISNRLHANGNNSGYPYCPTAPSSADQYSEAVVRAITDEGNFSLLLRLSNSANTYYALDRTGGYWRIISVVNGVENWFGGITEAITVGQDYTARLEVEGTTLRFYLNGVLRDTRTNADIAAAGYLGLRLDDTNASTGWHIASVDAGILGSGGGGGSPPATPTGLTASDGTSSSQIDVLWNAASGATSYDLQVSTDGGSTWANLSTGQAGTTYSHTGLATGVTHHYRVRANNGAGSSAYSASEQGSTASSGGGITLGAFKYEAMERSIAFELPFTGTPSANKRCGVEISWNGGITWKPWFDAAYIAPPSYAPTAHRFRGMVFGLDPAIPHELRLTVSQTGAVTGTNPRTQAFTTLAEVEPWETAEASTTYTYYVNAETGNDANPGTLVSPKRTIYNLTGNIHLTPSLTHSYALNEHWLTTANRKIFGGSAPVSTAGTASTGARVIFEYGNGGANSNAVTVSGPAGASATYPQVTNAPWTADGTITDARGIVRTVYYWETNRNPVHLGYSTTRFGDLQAIATFSNQPKDPISDASLPALTVAEWRTYMANNTVHHSAWLYDTASGRVYVIMPDATLNPNTLYMVCGGGTGFDVYQPGCRLSGVVLRGFFYGVATRANADDFVLDRCDIQQSFSGVQVFGDTSPTPDDYARRMHVFSNRFYWGNLWSTAQALTNTREEKLITWGYIKGDPVVAGIRTTQGVKIGKPGQDCESQAMFFRGGANGVTFRSNLIDGPFNGLVGYPSGYDEYAQFGLEGFNNLVRHVADDAWEPEHQSGPWALWDNDHEYCAVGLSTGPASFGPFYLIRNRFWRFTAGGVGRTDAMYAEVASTIWKLGGGPDPTSRAYFLQNTFWTDLGADYSGYTTQSSGYDHNSGGSDEDLTAYNNLIRATRFAARIPNPATHVSDGNHYVTAQAPSVFTSNVQRGVAYQTSHTTNVAAFRTEYAAQTGLANPRDNTDGDFITKSVADNALTNPTAGLSGLTLSGSTFVDGGALIPIFPGSTTYWSEPYPGSGPVRLWHYTGTAPNKGYDQQVTGETPGSSVTVVPAARTAAASTGAPAVRQSSLAVVPAALAAGTTTTAPAVRAGDVTITSAARTAGVSTTAPTVRQGSLALVPSLVTATASRSGLAVQVTGANVTMAPAAAGAAAAAVDPAVLASTPPVSTAPIISNALVVKRPTSATVTWTTDVPATSEVEYGPTLLYGSVAPPEPDPALTTEHAVTVTGLAPDTPYFVRVRSEVP